MSYLKFFQKRNAPLPKVPRPKANSLPMEEENEAQQSFDDLGFGEKLNAKASRLITSDGQFNIERRGPSSFNLYQWLVTTSFLNFSLFVLAFYIGINVLFAFLFMSCGFGSLSGMDEGSFLEHFSHGFFFSVQTFTTVGYGSTSPVGLLANSLAAFDALVGLMSFALATGLLFARFSRPSAHIRFSKKILVSPYQDKKGLMFRIVNLRESQLRDVEAQVVLTWLCVDKEGQTKRKFDRLELERYQVSMFPLNWTIVHPIDEKSPFWQKKVTDLAEMDIEVIIIIKAYDDTFSQMVVTNHSYKIEQLQTNATFLPMYYVEESGKTILEIDKIDEVMSG